MNGNDCLKFIFFDVIIKIESRNNIQFTWRGQKRILESLSTQVMMGIESMDLTYVSKWEYWIYSQSILFEIFSKRINSQSVVFFCWFIICRLTWSKVDQYHWRRFTSRFSLRYSQREYRIFSKCGILLLVCCRLTLSKVD